MRRREFIAVTGGTALAGCTSGVTSPSNGETRRTLTPAEPTSTRVGDVDLPVARSEMYAALPRDRIPAIVEPQFAPDWSPVSIDGESVSLPEEAPVVGVRRAGVARAYPLRILNWHEIVNDDFGGPLLVTYCVQCGSAVVAERHVAGQPTVFGVSGLLWRADLVMYDQDTESLWSQLLATAINGPRTGDQLTLLPSSLTSWRSWRDDHPDTDILLPPPHSNTLRGPTATQDYAERKYPHREGEQIIGRDSTDGGLHPKTLVVGVVSEEAVRAYPFPVVRDAGVVNDRVGDRPVLVTVTPGGGLVAYERRAGGDVLTFEPAGMAHLRAGGSRWRRTTGRAVDGPYTGQRLDRASPVPAMYWFGWSRFHPTTDVYGVTRPTPPA